MRCVTYTVAIVALIATTSGAAGTAYRAPGRILLLRIPPVSDLSALYSANADGSGLRRIASARHRLAHDADRDCADDRTATRDICIGIDDARWSPDGERVAFTSFIGECPQPCRRIGLYVADANGRSTRRLAYGSITDLDWAPDGRRIVFSREESRARQIYVVTVSGVLRRIVSAAKWPGAWKAAWSPNGRRIAFVRGFVNGQDEIWVVRPDGGKKRRIAETTDEQAVYSPPDWSADSRWISYVGEFAEGDVYVVRADGTRKANLTPSHDAAGQAGWAPRGSAIAYTILRSCGMSGPSDPCVSSQIVVQSTRTSSSELIDDDDVSNHLGFSWSPDARMIAFARGLYPSDAGIYRKTLGHPGLTRLVAGDNWFVVDWAPK
jgi:Tol biopolymer transport system component